MFVMCPECGLRAKLTRSDAQIADAEGKCKHRNNRTGALPGCIAFASDCCGRDGETPMSARNTGHVTCHECGMSAEIRLDKSIRGAGYKVSCYGSGYTCNKLLAAKLIDYTLDHMLVRLS